MIFVKAVNESEQVVGAELTDTNIFTHCAHCDKELEIEREELRHILGSDTPLNEARLFCDEHFHQEFTSLENSREEETEAVSDEETNEEAYAESVKEFIEGDDPATEFVNFVGNLPLTFEERVNLGVMFDGLLDMARNEGFYKGILESNNQESNAAESE